MNYKLEMDKAILNALQIQKVLKARSSTKGQFEIQTQTNSGHHLIDKDWSYTANPEFKKFI